MKSPRSKREKAGGARRIALLAHRYVGLVMSVFLLVAGATGSLLVFYHELDAALNPELRRVAPPSADAKPLEPFELQRRFAAQLKAGHTDATVHFSLEPHESMSAWVELDADHGREVFVDPYTGAELGSREWGNLRDGFRANLMPFIYRLHYSLALDDMGMLVFGMVALLWTIDCFVGAYLTFPLATPPGGVRQRSWFVRWLPAWQLRVSKLFSLVFTWHRASGLWIWALLLVFAWSAVGLNLPGVYQPVMRTLAGFQAGGHDQLPELKPPFPEAKLTLAEAHALGRRLMDEQAKQRGFTVVKELRLQHHREHAAFSYDVESSLDISQRFARTQVFFDARDGHLLNFDAPTSISAGNTITAWLYGLHFAAVGGLWYRLLVCLIGLMVATLSVTGVWIWLRKRSKQNRASLARNGSSHAPERSLVEPDTFTS